jgi:hypothetical protein
MNPPELPASETAVAPGSARPAVRWLLFSLALLAPPFLTILVAFLDNKGGAAPAIATLGGGVGGIVCGVMLGRRFGSTPQSKIGLSVLFALVMAVVVISMSCCGCLASGFKLDFR